MESAFSPFEVLKIALRVEKNGESLYTALETKAGDEKLRSMWRYLKEQEKKHQQTFQAMLNNTGDYVIREIKPGEYMAYLNAIANEYIITQELTEKKLKEGFDSDLDAVEFGIYIEKESILTYSALREYLVTSSQPVLDKIIEEEKKHLIDLAVIKTSLKDGG